MQPVHMRAFLILCASVCLSACTTTPSTPYAPMREGKGPFGYASEAIGDQLFRVEFWGSAKTPERTARAFALFRAAELANSLNATAFTVESGPVDRSVLGGDDTFSANEWTMTPGFASQEFALPGALRRVQTATVSIPIYIETPEARDARTASKLVILRVRMHLTGVGPEGPRMFLTEDVLRRLGPRIVRGKSA